MTASAGGERRFGIEALNVYCGLAAIPVRAIFKGRNLSLDRFGNLMMEKRSIGLPCEDPVTNAVNAAKPIIDQLSEDQRGRIEIIITSSESGIDYSKSIASYVHEYLGLGPELPLNRGQAGLLWCNSSRANGNRLHVSVNDFPGVLKC